jgi:transcriptional regulator with XRE-family HTH domain
MTEAAADLRASESEMQRRLGAAIRSLRRSQGLTLTELAGLAELSHSFLSQLERGLARPSMSSLHRIARSLGTTQPALMSIPADGQVTDRVSLVPAGSGLPVDNVGGTARSLAAKEHALYPLLFEGAPVDYGPYYSHDTEEFIYVIAGSIEVDITGEGTFVLQPGDTLHYSPRLAHRWRGVGDRLESVRALFVQTALPARQPALDSSHDGSAQ